VLPLDDRSFERVLPEISKKPALIGNKQILLPGMGGLVEQHVVNWRNRSWSLTSLLDIPDGGADGVILDLGGHGGGWSFYLKDGKPAYCYNLFGIDRTYVRGQDAVPAGEHQLRVEFAYDGGGLGKGGEVTLYLDGGQVAAGRVEHTEGIGFGYEYTDVGCDDLSPVTDDYPAGDNAFTGTIKWIELEAGEDTHDHLIDPEDFIRLAMAKQ
jgi:arylsulfatase